MWVPPFVLEYFDLPQLRPPMLVLQLVVIENSVEPGESGFPKRGYDRGVDGWEEGRLGERMSKEKRE